MLSKLTFIRFVARSATALALVSCLSSVSFAGTVNYDFNYSGTGVTATGVLTISDTLDSLGGYDILGITGNRNGDVITGLIGLSGVVQPDVGVVVFDNVFFAPGNSFDYNGLFFSTASGGRFNPFLADPNSGYFELDGTAEVATPIAFSASPSVVPEPTTIALLGLGLLGFAASRRKSAI